MSALPLKVLCIHGYRQNSQAFRERTGAFRKIIKKHAELVFVTAPNIVPADPVGDPGASAEATAGPGDGQRGWWFSAQNDSFDAHDNSACWKGYDESLKVIEEAFEKEGPFDGVLGFSQGASMISLMCALQERKETSMSFNFAILVAGFRSRSSGHDDLYSNVITLPTLHVFGDTDKVIEKNMSEHLLQYFNEPTILNHPGGHFIPASGPQKRVYLDFLNKMIEMKKSLHQ